MKTLESHYDSLISRIRDRRNPYNQITEMREWKGYEKLRSELLNEIIEDKEKLNGINDER